MKTIIEMAREAGWRDLRDYDSEMYEAIFMGSVDSLKAFAALVRADERAACKAACQAIAEHYELVSDSRAEAAADECVIAIQARGNT